MAKRKLNDVAPIGFVGNFLNENAPTITFIGSLLTLGFTLYAAFKASKPVSVIQEKYEEKVQEIDPEAPEGPEKLKEAKGARNVALVLAYKYVILGGGSTFILMFLSHYLNGAKIAGLTAALALSEDKIKKLVENGKQLIGEEKFKEIEDKSLEDLIQNNFLGKDSPAAFIAAHDKGTFYVDSDLGTIFQMRESEVIRILKYAEDYCARNHGLSEDKLYEFFGLEPHPKSKNRMWGPNRPFKAHIGKRTAFGMEWNTIEYEYLPTAAKLAGIPSI